MKNAALSVVATFISFASIAAFAATYRATRKRQRRIVRGAKTIFMSTA